jgi:putative transposase
VPRKPRIEVEGGIHHVFARGNDRRDVFVDDADRRLYLATLGGVVRWKRWRCLAYCLMPNHIHLLLETPHANLGAGMQYLHGSYATEFNQRHGRFGHVFQGRYGSVLVTTDEQLWHVAAYIALTPVCAGLCERPEQRPWSSHASTVGEHPRHQWLDVARLLSHFEGLGGEARERYVEITRADVGQAAATVSADDADG